ncbi:MAG: radical SAM protein [Clostridia bacterium]|nr:radical SAM protein [Clostridia bacterium]
MIFEEYCASVSKKYISNNRILFINPPQFDTRNFSMEIAKKRGYYIYPPTGLLFLSSALKDFDIDIRICDLNFEILRRAIDAEEYNDECWKEIIDESVRSFKPSVIGVSCMFSHISHVYENVMAYVIGMEEYCVLSGGPHVTFEHKDLLNKGLCHFAMVHDGESKIRYLVNQLFSLGQHVQTTDGIYFKVKNEIRVSEGITFDSNESDIDLDISNSYELIDISQYCKYGSLNQFSRIIGMDNVFTSVSMNRGCRGHCTFCSVRTLLGKKIRSRSVESIISELKYLKEKKSLQHFDWLDDDLLADRARCIHLFERMKEEKLDLKWYANNGLIAASLDDTMLKAMSESGCVGFKLGIESGNVEVLKKIRKPATIESLLRASKLINNYPKIFTAGNYIIGFPDETFSQMLDTFIFSNRMKLDWSGFYICQPLKGADAFDSFESIGDERCREKPDYYIPNKAIEGYYKKKNKEIASGLDIFDLDKNFIVSKEQLDEIWFVFGFITNFINNKNLREGSIDKFSNWVNAASMAYPFDAGMTVFLYVANMLEGDIERANGYYQRTVKILDYSEYWRKRFEQFNLDVLVNRKDLDRNSIKNCLVSIMHKVENIIGVSLN